MTTYIRQKIISIIRITRTYGFWMVFSAGIKEIFRRVYLEKILGSYSQYGEDIVVEKLLNKKNGFYLEIGAYHPTRLSNTYRFYKKGWSGVVVEPNKEVVNEFKTKRPKDVLIKAGIGKKKGVLKYYKYLIPALNTFSYSQVKENKIKGFNYYEIEKTKVINICDLLKDNVNKEIDFLSIDTEGWDEVILENWDWGYQPRVICVEYGGNENIGNLLKGHGYSLSYSNKSNSIYYR